MANSLALNAIATLSAQKACCKMPSRPISGPLSTIGVARKAFRKSRLKHSGTAAILNASPRSALNATLPPSRHMRDSGRNYLAIDLGAESGRIILGQFNAGLLTTTEVRRFLNEP